MVENELKNQILTMQGLKMVNVYPLFEEDDALMGVMAYYQDKTINLCSADREFPLLLDRVIKLYQEESKHSNIIADESTKQLLSKASEFPDEKLYTRLGGYRETDRPAFLPKGFSHVYIIPVVTYILKQLYEGMHESVSFQELSQQWFEKGFLNAVVNGKSQRFPFRISPLRQEQYDIAVLNVLKVANTLKMRLMFDMNGIKVTYHDECFRFQGSIAIDVLNDKMIFSHSLTEQGQKLIEIKCELEEAKWGSPTKLVKELTTGDGGDWNACTLPWGGFVYHAELYGDEYLVYSNVGATVTVSYGSCRRRLSIQGKEEIMFGMFSFRLYEREDLTELHFLDMGYPSSAKYARDHAGRFFVRELENRNKGEQIDGN